MFDTYLPLMGLNHAVDDGQAETGAVIFGGEEGGEDFFYVGVRAHRARRIDG